MIKRIYRIYRIFEKGIYKALALRNVRKYGKKIYVNYYCRFNENTELGNNVHFNGLKVYGKGELVIKSNFHSAPECSIITDIHNYKGEGLPYDQTTIRKRVIIEENVWLGLKVIILPGVTIGEGAIIQAGSCVTTDIPPLAIAGGHPAKVFKYRDTDHYTNLKEKEIYF
ncbi:MAG: acetyltransferase-like isoleucine patch superfamily enzyme [Cyclobacteriaceae bacterium]